LSEQFRSIGIIGAGSIGTALGNILAAKDNLEVTLLSIEKDVVESVNRSGYNHKYFPNIRLNRSLKATLDPSQLKGFGIVFLATPSNVTVDYVMEVSEHLRKDAILLNLAKGFSRDSKTITRSLREKLPNPVCALKGPTFARDLMNDIPTAFTLGAEQEDTFRLMGDLFDGTPVHLDYSKDVDGVEVLSILKNIYAIAMGIVDAHFDTPNLRFLALARAFDEMKRIHLQFGGDIETLFRYCGIGDFSLTALNDLSRNRTLGLLIGKGFFTKDISDKVLLEGKIAVNVFCEQIPGGPSGNDFPIIRELYKVFNNGYRISDFINCILKGG
jgi:glycerol-3-phosphate dehydrogenase (NAD(P)+)